MRVIGINVPNSAREPQGCSQQQRRAESMRLVNRERVRIGPTRTALTWIGKVLETIEARA